MKSIRIATVFLASSLAAAGAIAGDKAASGNSASGATTEKGRTAGGVSEDLLKEFRALDANKDGFLSKSELSSKPDLLKAFEKADKNGDGKLDLAEFQALEANSSSDRSLGSASPVEPAAGATSGAQKQ